MVVVWVDIWDSQSSSLAKNIINCRFNIGQFVVTVCGTNMSLGIPQCKNCQKQGHLTLSCCSHVSRCAKCYRAHITEHYKEKVWYCMKNKKVNQVATKEGEPYSHIFKYMNCKGNYQVDSVSYSYWHNHFNRDWYSRKQQELFCKQSTVNVEILLSICRFLFSFSFSIFILFAHQYTVVTKQLSQSTTVPCIINC